MKILHIINGSISDTASQIIDVQAKENDVKIIALSRKEVSYEDVIDDIFSHDRVISW